VGGVTQPQAQNRPDEIYWTVLRVHVMDPQIVLVCLVYWHMPIPKAKLYIINYLPHSPTVQVIDNHETGGEMN